jgi:uncharacterized protein (DUF4415 family)
MPENGRVFAPIAPSDAPPRTIGSDLGRIDAHAIAPEECDEAPEVTDAMFARGRWVEPVGQRPPGRPRSDAPKRLTTLRLDADLLERMRSEGKGWQSRVNAILRVHFGL